MMEVEKELRKATDFRSTSSASSPSRNLNRSQESENSIQPPPATPPTQTEATETPQSNDDSK